MNNTPPIKLKEVFDTSLLLTPEKNSEALTLLWNVGTPTSLSIDGHPFDITSNCLLFISEFYTKIEGNLSQARIITFDKTFVGSDSSQNQLGNFLLLFYGNSFLNGVPKITLNEEEAKEFQSLWEHLDQELMNRNNPISEALARNTFQRLMLLSQKIHLQNSFDLPIDFKDLRVIREFQYLVEMHFKELTKVSDYAKLLGITPKKISELFNCCYQFKASEVISNRRNLYAKKMLIYSDELIKNIAFDLNFSDSQSFSHFFKKHNGQTPEEFRKENSTPF